MKIQQHDGVVVDAGVTAAGLRCSTARGRGVAGEREAPRVKGAAAPPSPLYIGSPRGGAVPRRWDLLGGAAAKGGVAPKASGAPPHPRVSNPRRRGEAHGGRRSPLRAGSLPTSAHGPLRDGWPHPVDPRDPSGGPGTIPMTPETFPMAETGLPIYESLPPDHSGTPRDVRDLIRDSEQLLGYRILISQQP